MWANPHYNKENPLEKYAAHVRRRLWRDLDSLEGKLLGCWCENEHECHGRVLVELLEEKKNEGNKPKFSNMWPPSRLV